jgi:protein PhnA
MVSRKISNSSEVWMRDCCVHCLIYQQVFTVHSMAGLKNLFLRQKHRMGLDIEVQQRSGNSCELCHAENELSVYVVPPKGGTSVDEVVHVCRRCKTDIEDPSTADVNHWRCLNDAIWSEVDAVKVVAFRMLNHLIKEGWTADLLEMMYLDDDTREWATSEMHQNNPVGVHRDSNGAILSQGDTVTVIKDLSVKGSSLVAKRGTAVRNIRLVHDNEDQIEGKVEGQNIVLLTKYVKKS